MTFFQDVPCPLSFRLQSHFNKRTIRCTQCILGEIIHCNRACNSKSGKPSVCNRGTGHTTHTTAARWAAPEASREVIRVHNWDEKTFTTRTSLLVQGLRIPLAMQGQGFDPWLGTKITRAVEELSLHSGACTRETQCSQINRGLKGQGVGGRKKRPPWHF